MKFTNALLRRRTVMVVLAALVLAVPMWWFGWMAPEASKLASVQKEQETAAREKTTLVERLGELREDRADAKAAAGYLARFEDAVPKTPDAASLVVEVYELAQRDGVKLSSITDNSETANVGYSTIPVSIEVAGANGNVLSFVKGLYTIPRLLTVQALDLSGSGDLTQSSQASTTASITATAYTLQVGSPHVTSAEG